MHLWAIRNALRTSRWVESHHLEYRVCVQAYSSDLRFRTTEQAFPVEELALVEARSGLKVDGTSYLRQGRTAHLPDCNKTNVSSAVDFSTFCTLLIF